MPHLRGQKGAIIPSGKLLGAVKKLRRCIKNWKLLICVVFNLTYYHTTPNNVYDITVLDNTLFSF